MFISLLYATMYNVPSQSKQHWGISFRENVSNPLLVLLPRLLKASIRLLPWNPVKSFSKIQTYSVLFVRRWNWLLRIRKILVGGIKIFQWSVISFFKPSLNMHFLLYAHDTVQFLFQKNCPFGNTCHICILYHHHVRQRNLSNCSNCAYHNLCHFILLHFVFFVMYYIFCDFFFI